MSSQLQAQSIRLNFRRAPKPAANTLRKRAHTSLNMSRPALLLLAVWQAASAFRVPAPVVQRKKLLAPAKLPPPLRAAAADDAAVEKV